MAKNQGRWEKRKIGVIFSDWGAENAEKIEKRCTQILESGDDRDFIALLKTYIASQPQAHEVSGPDGGPIEVKWPGV